MIEWIAVPALLKLGAKVVIEVYKEKKGCRLPVKISSCRGHHSISDVKTGSLFWM